MGKQIAIVMTDKDEQLFLSYLNSANNIALVESFAQTKELLWKKNFDEYNKHQNYYVWNKQFPWEPQYKQTIHGKYYISNTYDAPLLQYSRSDITSGNYGRLYWSRYFAAPNGLAYDVGEFEKWYDEIIKWVKKNAKGKIKENWITYFLPNAWDTYQKTHFAE